MVSAARPWAASDMPRTLRQLWADEDEDHDRELAAKRRASRLRAKRDGRARRSVVIHGKAQ
jgi:hypothetical protein